MNKEIRIKIQDGISYGIAIEIINNYIEYNTIDGVILDTGNHYRIPHNGKMYHLILKTEKKTITAKIIKV